jgi:hypothetical protein
VFLGCSCSSSRASREYASMWRRRSELRGEVVGVKRWCHFFYCTVLLLCLRVRMDGNYSKRTPGGGRWGPPCSETYTSRFPPPKEGEWVTILLPYGPWTSLKRPKIFEK